MKLPDHFQRQNHTEYQGNLFLLSVLYALLFCVVLNAKPSYPHSYIDHKNAGIDQYPHSHPIIYKLKS